MAWGQCYDSKVAEQAAVIGGHLRTEKFQEFRN
jgi:hypothetical protein